MKYQFLKDFYDYMESSQSKGENVTMCTFAPLSQAKYIKRFVDPETGEKKQNPLIGKIFKNTAIEYTYGESYAAKMKALNPNWVPSGTTKYEDVPDNPLLKFCPSTETYSVGIVEPETVDSQYLYYDVETEEILPWDNVKWGDVKNYIHSSYPSNSPVRYQHYGADTIYSIACNGHVFINTEMQTKYKDIWNKLF